MSTDIDYGKEPIGQDEMEKIATRLVIAQAVASVFAPRFSAKHVKYGYRRKLEHRSTQEKSTSKARRKMATRSNKINRKRCPKWKPLMPFKDRERKREYQRRWVAARRQKYLGGKKCAFCGTEESLQLHHIDPSEKDSHRIFSWSEKRIKAEMAKCLIVCLDCHAELHAAKVEIQPLNRETLANLPF